MDIISVDVGNIYRYIVVGDIYSYILGYIYRYMVGYLQIQGFAEICYRNQRLFHLVLINCQFPI